MKKSTSLLVFGLMFFGLVAQTTFNKRYHFDYNAAMFGSIFPTDSCYYTTGVIVDTAGSGNLGNLFSKLDLEGNVLHTNSLIDTTKSIQMWLGELVQTSDDHFADVGFTTAPTGMKAFLVKFTDEGDTLFTKEYPNPYPDETFIVSVDLKTTDDGGFYFTCGFNPSVNGAEGDILILKLDSLGNVKWQTEFGNHRTEIGGRTIVDEDGGLLVGACQTNSNQVSNGKYRITYLFKLDSTGQFEWEYLSSIGTVQDIAYGLEKTEDGGLVIATSRGFEEDVNGSVGILYWNSAYFFKLNSDRELVWELEVPDSINSGPVQGIQSMLQVDNGEAYVVAGAFNMIRSLEPPVGGTFGWFIKFSDNGELLWIRKHQILETLGHQHKIYDLKQAPDGGLIAAGEVRGFWNDGEATLQAWLLKLDEHGCLIPGCEEGDTVTSSIDLSIEMDIILAIYPNPTTDYLNFQLRTPRNIHRATFRILNAQGVLVREFNSDLAKETHILPIWDWPNGTYFLQTVVEGEVLAAERFVVQK